VRRRSASAGIRDRSRQELGIEQFVIAYKASTLKQPVMKDLLEWLIR